MEAFLGLYFSFFQMFFKSGSVYVWVDGERVGAK